MSVLSDFAAKYGPIVVGLLIGSAAKYGLTLNEGRPITVRGLLADVLLLGMIGLLSIVVADYLGLTGNPKVLLASMAAVSADRLVRWARDRFEQRVQAELERLANRGGTDAG